MADLLMNPQDDPDVINLEDNEDPYSNSFDLEKEKNSDEDKKASWWDFAKDVVVQPALGIAQRWTWPADILKLGTMGSALEGLDEFESAAEKSGIPFNRSDYIKAIAEQGSLIPTQSMAEDLLQDAYQYDIVYENGKHVRKKVRDKIDLKPTSETGKVLRKFFTIGGFTPGSLARKGVAGATAVTTKEALERAGFSETTADIGSDIFAGMTGAIETAPRQFTPEVQNLMNIADTHGLPFFEFMTREEPTRIAPRITQATEQAVERQLGMSSQEAIDNIIANNNEAFNWRNQGINLEALEQRAYQTAENLSLANPSRISTDNIVQDINSEIARIRGNAPSPSDADLVQIRILENERDALVGQVVDANQMINQKINYNSNVKSIYRKPEFSGNEDAARRAYAFLNESILNTLDRQAASDVANAVRAADRIYSQNQGLRRVEGILGRAFENGEYNPERLHRILAGRNGNFLRRELGDQAVNQINDIAHYGRRAQENTNAFLRSNRGPIVSQWGQLSPFVLFGGKYMKGILSVGRPAAQYIQGYLLTRPATREVYQNIIRNAAKGSFNNMASDFHKLESEISKEFGDVDSFMKNVVDELEIVD